VLGKSAPVNRENGTHRLYQWLSQRASFFRMDTSDHGSSRIVRTEVRVEREAVTLLVGDAAAGFDKCPLCGSNFASAPRKTAKHRLPQGSTPAEKGGSGN